MKLGSANFGLVLKFEKLWQSMFWIQPNFRIVINKHISKVPLFKFIMIFKLKRKILHNSRVFLVVKKLRIHQYDKKALKTIKPIKSLKNY